MATLIHWTKPSWIKGETWNELHDALVWGDGPLASPEGYSAMIKRTKGQAVHVEVRKNFPGANLLLIVALDGWNHGHDKRDPDRWGNSTRGYQVRLSCNAGMWGQVQDLHEIARVGEECRAFLLELERRS